MKKTFLIICFMCMILVTAGCSNDSNDLKLKHAVFEENLLTQTTEPNLSESDSSIIYNLSRDPHSSDSKLISESIETKTEVFEEEKEESDPPAVHHILKDPHSKGNY